MESAVQRAKHYFSNCRRRSKKKVHEWNDDEATAIRNVIGAEFKVEGQLRSETQLNIKRLMDIGSYRGIRHSKGLTSSWSKYQT
jgi:ribosomal protein S13